MEEKHRRNKNDAVKKWNSSLYESLQGNISELSETFTGIYISY